MTRHGRKTSPLKSLSLSKRQWAKIGAVIAAGGLIAGAGFASRNFYQSDTSTVGTHITAFSATDSAASRSATRGELNGADKNTTYVTVKINGDSRVVLGEKSAMKTVKDVLDAGNITLDPADTVSPSLKSKVTEATVITIERAGAEVETSDTDIPFNEVRKETSDLPKGTEKVETEGENGVMETTSLVTRAGDKVVSSNVFTSWVKKAPVDKVILVGTGSTSSSSSSSSSSSTSLGTTVPVGEMQTWAHDYLIANGYTEDDFTAANYIINHESGWSPTAANPSGAYGLPQALPGSKMASAGADWATNYQTQFKWFVSYCNGRYGSISAAYSHWLQYKSY
ncbi:G5 domain-containing protein [Bifidobacterium imperatoris]|uniref:G5 domain-containing protein n=1 Tax=Bifidobacterium imperatoris TaxID=2020965 RepID=A0A2N5IRH7_9BIFI|nr:G5 domain-containing protein [Bifidobacterium imperatoris]PLS24563.1 G5 domain-containing protein [Bifidobacterium imperatoris]QSY58058.1 G5 domain-containing protein [Bifidobacterium imperatoris]